MLKRLLIVAAALVLVLDAAEMPQATAARRRVSRTTKRRTTKRRATKRSSASRRSSARRPATRRLSTAARNRARLRVKRKRQAASRAKARARKSRRRKAVMSAQQRQRLLDSAKQRRQTIKAREQRYQEWRHTASAMQLFKRGSDGPSESGRAQATRGPVRYFELKGRVRLLASVKKPREGADKLVLKDRKWAKRRKEEFTRSARELVPHEQMSSLPTKFCVAKGRCFATYDEVRDALYGPRSKGGRSHATQLYSPPVFCAPALENGKWTSESVMCHSNWAQTVKPNDGEYPPFACLGHPHFTSQVIVDPEGGEVNGFICRERIFQVYDFPPIQDAEGKKRAIAGMCKDMRTQVWGEEIASTFTSSTGLSPDSVKTPPKIPLTREELLYFFGNRPYYCRADRQGLIHRSRNAEKQLGAKTGVILGSKEHWAKTFTCGVPRGVVEAGPFEEGVQLCAVTPYDHDLVYTMRASAAARKEARSLRKGRLHCWKFHRPTCEELAFQDSMNKQQKLDTLFKSDVFDFYDAHRELRRTGTLKVLDLKDLKEAEKVPDLEEAYAFTDVAGDEGTFGIEEFCRFVGDSKKVICGYDKASIARHYELHQQEGGKASGCGDGVCDRGAFERGYTCAIFSMADYFNGKPVWVCGADQEGAAGRRLVERARMICMGGRYATAFVSPKGQRSTLQCYERKFVWAASSETKSLSTFSVAKALSDASKAVRGSGYGPYEEFYTAQVEATSSKKTKARRAADQDLKSGLEEMQGVVESIQSLVKQGAPLGKVLVVHKVAASFLKQIKSAVAKLKKKQRELAKKLRTQVQKLDKLRKKAPWDRAPVNVRATLRSAIKQISRYLTQKAKNANKTVLKYCDKFLKAYRQGVRDIQRKAKRDDRRAEEKKQLGKRVARKNAARAMEDHIRSVRTHIAQWVKGQPLGFLGHRASSRGFFNTAGKPPWLSEMTSWAKRAAKSTKNAKAKDVAEKILEVINNETAAHDRWIQEVLLSAKDEEKGFLVSRDILIKAIQQNMLTRMLDELRAITLEQAQRYASAVIRAGEKAKRAGDVLTRIELMERAKSSEIFCVESKSSSRLRGTFVCGTSPLLIAGEMERYAGRVGHLQSWSKYLGRLRGRRSGRAGGGAKKFTMRIDPNALKRALAKRGATRSQTRRPAGRTKTRSRVASRPAVRRKSTASSAKRSRRMGLRGWLRTVQQWRRRRVISEATERIRKNFQTRWCYYVRSPTWAKEKSPALSGGFDSPYEVQVPQAAGSRKEVAFLWLRCQGFKYIDELWEKADRKRWAELHKFDVGEAVKYEKQKEQTAGGAGAVSDPRAAKHTKRISSAIGGFLGRMLSMAMPELGKLSQLLGNISNLGSSFFQEFADKIKETLTAGPWQEAQQAVAEMNKAIGDSQSEADERRKKLEEAKAKVGERKDDLHKAELAYATAPPPTKKSKEAEKTKARDALKAAKDQQKSAEKDLAAALKNVEKARKGLDQGRVKLRNKLRQISVSSILVEMVNKLSTLLSKRIAEAIKPRAASLFRPVFKWVRGLLNPIATAVIQALAAIPFTFGALGYIGQVVYTIALDKLEELALNALVGVVERFVSKGIRGLLGPLVSAAKPVLIRMVKAACSAIGPLATNELCSQERFAALDARHRWLNRALACRYSAPRITPKMRQDAIAARFEIIRKVDSMRENLEDYVRGLATPVLARFGYNYDTWMAAFSPTAKQDDRVVAALVSPALVEHVEELVGAMTPLRRTPLTASPYWPRYRGPGAVAEAQRSPTRDGKRSGGHR